MTLPSGQWPVGHWTVGSEALKTAHKAAERGPRSEILRIGDLRAGLRGFAAFGHHAPTSRGTLART